MTQSILNTGIRDVKNISRYQFGVGAIVELAAIVQKHRNLSAGYVVFFIDKFFEANGLPQKLDAIREVDCVIFVDTTNEPTTVQINRMRDRLVSENRQSPCVMVGIGGGATMDVTKAVANLLTNGGNAEDYQGWDLVRQAGVFKIAVPTISGTGAESTRTCVMTNPASGLKLGMNSDFTVYDQVIMDPELTATVPRNQYFYTGMDAYIHCIESLAGSYHNAIGDAYSRETLNLCRQVFLSRDMMSLESREQLMVASYLGGCAIATSYVGVVHPFSAGLSVVLGVHHCLANCIVMRAMEPFYPDGYREFWRMAECQGVEVPEGICRNLTDEQHDRLYEATVIHQKPLTNALGEKYKDILTREKVREIFLAM